MYYTDVVYSFIKEASIKKIFFYWDVAFSVVLSLRPVWRDKPNIFDILRHFQETHYFLILSENLLAARDINPSLMLAFKR